MLKSLGLPRWGGKRSAPVAALPEGRRVYAVGDIHGRLDLLDELLDLIARDDAGRPPAQVDLIFLGDLIDRGPHSAGVIDRLMALRLDGFSPRFILGNHEEMLLNALEATEGEVMRFFLRNGGRETLLSYPIGLDEFEEGSLADLRQLARDRIPPAHLAFIAGFEDHVEIGDYFFVHAGIRPGVPLDRQSLKDLRWIRQDFLNSQKYHGRLVVHGHSISATVDCHPNRIGLDTGAFDTGTLSAMGAEGVDRWFLATEADADPT